MNKTSDRIDSVAIILLCLAGLASTLCIMVAGSPRYGVLSAIWQKVGIEALMGLSFGSLLIAAFMLRRIYRVTNLRAHCLLALLVVSATPFAFFAAVLVARFIHGE